ncbi:MAG TPA: hypothetical protein VET45_17725 [Candidatus Binatia bacterium]|nr:hypothetical protein [Candidatus Binatia bacterium]
MTPKTAPQGLCATCAHARTVASAKGSAFVLCGLSRTDGRFAKYPRLPVLACVGFEAAAPAPQETQGHQR